MIAYPATARRRPPAALAASAVVVKQSDVVRGRPAWSISPTIRPPRHDSPAYNRAANQV